MLRSIPAKAAQFRIEDKEGKAIFSVAGFYDAGFAALSVQTEKGKVPWESPKP